MILICKLITYKKKLKKTREKGLLFCYPTKFFSGGSGNNLRSGNTRPQALHICWANTRDISLSNIFLPLGPCLKKSSRKFRKMCLNLPKISNYRWFWEKDIWCKELNTTFCNREFVCLALVTAWCRKWIRQLCRKVSLIVWKSHICLNILRIWTTKFPTRATYDKFLINISFVKVSNFRLRH